MIGEMLTLHSAHKIHDHPPQVSGIFDTVGSATKMGVLLPPPYDLSNSKVRINARISVTWDMSRVEKFVLPVGVTRSLLCAILPRSMANRPTISDVFLSLPGRHLAAVSSRRRFVVAGIHNHLPNPV
jgi:hypothetical protein